MMLNMPNIPNLLTIVRILLTPFFVILLLKDMYSLALAIFAIAGVQTPGAVSSKR